MGRRLLLAIEARAADLNINRLQLLIDRTNTPACEFYQQTGWAGTQLVRLRKKRQQQKKEPFPLALEQPGLQ